MNYLENILINLLRHCNDDVSTGIIKRVEESISNILSDVFNC